MVLFMLHCSGNNILINTGHGNTRKIIEISCPVLSKIEYKGLSGKYMFLLVTIIFQVFSGKARKNEKHWSILNIWKICKFRDELNDVRGHSQKTFLCKIYGYKNLSSMNVVQKCMFTSKYEKGKKSLGLCMLPWCQQNLKLHMRRPNYVATIFNLANMLQIDLNSQFKHGWVENLTTVWWDIAFPEHIPDMLFVVDNWNNYERDYEGYESP